MTTLAATGAYLAEHRQAWRGTVMLIGQPAEERGSGAKAMLEAGLFARFGKPDFAVALHVDPSLAAGKVGVAGGFLMANVDSVDITVKGRGGHGSAPHLTVDPIVEAAQLVVALQTIVSGRSTRESGGDHRRCDPWWHKAQHHFGSVRTADHGSAALTKRRGNNCCRPLNVRLKRSRKVAPHQHLKLRSVKGHGAGESISAGRSIGASFS